MRSPFQPQLSRLPPVFGRFWDQVLHYCHLFPGCPTVMSHSSDSDDVARAPPAPARVRGRADGSALALAGGRAVAPPPGRRPATSPSRAAARGASAPSHGTGRGSRAAPHHASAPRGRPAGAGRSAGRASSRGRAASSAAAPRGASAPAHRAGRGARGERPDAGRPRGSRRPPALSSLHDNPQRERALADLHAADGSDPFASDASGDADDHDFDQADDDAESAAQFRDFWATNGHTTLERPLTVMLPGRACHRSREGTPRWPRQGPGDLRARQPTMMMAS